MKHLVAFAVWCVVLVAAFATSSGKRQPGHASPSDRRPTLYRHALGRRLRSGSPEARAADQDAVLAMLLQNTNTSAEESAEADEKPHRPRHSSSPAGKAAFEQTVSVGSTMSKRSSTSPSPPPSPEAANKCVPVKSASAMSTGHGQPDQVIDIAVITPCNATNQFSRQRVMPVVELAVRHLRRTGLRGPLANYTINVRYRDSRSSSTYGPLAAVDLYFNNAAGEYAARAPSVRLSGLLLHLLQALLLLPV
ncbi:uncharacterized protein LOC122255805 [Penaeus japonicus]|uniref:uncharacterized protein LOC122255805 n=1 Tax=Penaeus japonicus TaxID=27405 RepID=UPI001C715428|nr:uncharacterized protein LOC122255805 [Penaeus japonicus]